MRIAQQIAHAFGVDIDKDVVRRVLAKHYRPGASGSNGPSWLTFIGRMKDSLWCVDLFRCESILLHSHWVLLVMEVWTRRLGGYIGTKMMMTIPKEVLDSKILPQIPIGRLGKPEKIAGLIIDLYSDEAAFVTGADIGINGGQHMQ